MDEEGTAEKFDEEVAAALRENQKIPLSDRCSHPLATLEIEPNDHSPMWCRRNFVPKKHEERVTKEIERCLENGVVEDAPDDCKHCFPILSVPKKDGKGNPVDIRPCIDLRQLNRRLPDLEYPIPSVQEVLTELGSEAGAEVLYTSIDIRDGYNRFGILEKYRNLLAFMWNGRHLRYCAAPFGLKPMSFKFQQLMDKIFGHLPFVVVYIDDITIVSKNREEHVEHVKFVINELTRWNIPIREDKSRFGQKEIKLLGHIISGTGIRKDPRKVEVVKNWKKPKTSKQLCRFLGFANYYRQFISHFSTISSPLDEKRKTKGELKWDDQMDEAFKKLKDEIYNRIELLHPKPNCPYILCTDASDVGLGAWIGQKVGDKIHRISFASKALSKSQKSYSATKRELLAIVWALHKFRSYLLGKKFTIYTDHRALTFLLRQKDINAMVMRWFEVILEFNFDIVHLPGIKNDLADTLSRLNEAISFNSLTVAQVIRGKSAPTAEGERTRLIQRAHLFGHFGEQEIFTKLWNDGIWWNGMREAIKAELQNCTECLRFNVQKRGFHPLKSVTANLPWDHIAIDLITPVPNSKDGYNTILTIICMMTKFAILRPLKNKAMTTVATSLWEVFSIFGIPKIMQSDNGAEFVNEVVQELVRLNGIDHRTITPYNPKANGAVERVNATVENMIMKEVRGAMHEWSDYLPYLQLAYNNKTAAMTSSTPFSLMFGRSLNAFEKYGKTKTGNDMDIVMWKSRLETLTNHIYPAVNEKILTVKKKDQREFGKSHKIIEDDNFPPGAIVMQRDITRESKWDPRYEGPFMVLRRNRGGAYVLRDSLGQLKRAVPADQLKLVKRNGDNTVIEESVYEIKKIADHRTGKDGKIEYLVEWRSSGIEPSWEPVDNFIDVHVIKQYWKGRRPLRNQGHRP